MITVVLCSFIAILLTFLESKGKMRRGMLYGFIIVTFLGCIHYNYGNDYEGYMLWFETYAHQNLSYSNIFDDYNWEPGWVILNHIFKDVGFFALVAFVNIILNAIYFLTIRKYVKKILWPFAMSVYLLSTSLYILNFSMMRQGLAVAIFLLAWTFIRQGRTAPSLLLILLGASFHGSALILSPFALIGKAKVSNGKPIAIVMVVLFISLYLSATLAPDIFQAIKTWDYFFAQDSLDYYEKSKLLERTYGFGFIVNLVPFIVGISLLLRKNNKPEINYLTTICLFAFIVAPFGSVLSMLVRFSYYFVAYQVIGVPKMYSMISNATIRASATVLFYIMLIYGYVNFFSNPTWIRAYSEFHTIFEVI